MKLKMKKLKKGSAEAKDFMAKIRAKRGTPKKTAIKKVGSTLLINKGENPRKKATRIIRVDRTKKGTFKKFTTISGTKKSTYNKNKSQFFVTSDVRGKMSILQLKKDYDNSVILLNNAKNALIDKNNTNYFSGKPLVYKNITEKKSFIKHWAQQTKFLNMLYKKELKLYQLTLKK